MSSKAGGGHIDCCCWCLLQRCQWQCWGRSSSFFQMPCCLGGEFAERCSVLLRAAAEFELLGQQQEVASKLEAAQQQLNDAQSRAEAATAEGNSAREQLSQVRATCSVHCITLCCSLLGGDLSTDHHTTPLYYITNGTACRRPASSTCKLLHMCKVTWPPIAAMCPQADGLPCGVALLHVADRGAACGSAC